MEPTNEDLMNGFYSFSNFGEYVRIEVVIDSGAFISVLPIKRFPPYPLLPLKPRMIDGGKTATGQEVPTLGQRRLQVSLLEILDELMMNFKCLDGIQRPLGSVSELVRNHCRVVFDGVDAGGSYIFSRKN